MIASCSPWIVATMSRICPVRARPSSASIGSGTPPDPASESGSSKSSSKMSCRSGPVNTNRRRKRSPNGSASVAR
jgi:hypothetical protein